MTTQPGLFPAPTRASKRLPAGVAAGVSPRITRVQNATRQQCDYCVRVVHEDEGRGGAEIRTARFRRVDGVCDDGCRRRLRQGFGCQHITLLCTEHGQMQVNLDKEAEA